MINPFKWLRLRWDCFRRGEHLFVFDSPGLTGDWIRCSHCRYLDEYIPGAHEPKGYDYETATPERINRAGRLGV
jgi:hypothetical protein